MPFDEGLERGHIARGRAGHEIRIRRRVETVHSWIGRKGGLES